MELEKTWIAKIMMEDENCWRFFVCPGSMRIFQLLLRELITLKEWLLISLMYYHGLIEFS